MRNKEKPRNKKKKKESPLPLSFSLTLYFYNLVPFLFAIVIAWRESLKIRGLVVEKIQKNWKKKKVEGPRRKVFKALVLRVPLQKRSAPPSWDAAAFRYRWKWDP